MVKSFVHLHSHSEYSMLDGAARLNEYINKVKSNEQTAAAITDHGNLYGALEFYQIAKEAGIQPIIGYEAYLTPGSRFEKPKREDNIRYHLTILAENDVGYQNLIQIASRAYTEGYYYKPRIDMELLKEYSAGLIGLSGCLGGEVAQLLGPDSKSEEGSPDKDRDIDKAIERAKAYEDAGADIVFPEALRDEKEFEKVRKNLKVYLLANMTEFGKTKLLSYKQLEGIGYNIVIYPVTTQRLAMKSVEDGLKDIFTHGHQNNIIDKMQTRKRLYELVEYEKYNSLDEKIYNFKTEGHE